MHTSYHQAGAATGRLSSTDPNLQNIPIRTEDGRRIRKAFVAPPGRKIVACDYSQIELRIMAHLSRGSGPGARLRKRRRTCTARPRRKCSARTLDDVTGNQRRAAKAINFGLMYGMSAFGLARQLGIGRGEAQDYIALYFSRYPGRARLHGAHAPAGARATATSKPCSAAACTWTTSTRATQGQRAGAERAAINAPMQGTAADIIKRAMVAVDAWLAGIATRALMLLQVHDELVFEVDEDFVDDAAGRT